MMATGTDRAEFETRMFNAGTGEEVVKHLPKECRAVRAQLGDYVLVQGGDEGVIIGMTRDLCIFRSPDGVRGVRQWSAVSLGHLEPDPQQVD